MPLTIADTSSPTHPNHVAACIAAVIEADKKEDYSEVYKKIEECAKECIPFQSIEETLRRNSCKTYLVARLHEGSSVSFLPCQKPYYIYPATHDMAAAEIEDYDENFELLAQAALLETRRPPLANIINRCS